MDTEDTVVIVPEAAMAVGGATVRLLGLPVHAGPTGRTVTDDDRATIVARVERDLQHPNVTRIRGRVTCGQCDGPLLFPSRRSEKPIPVPLPDGVVTVLVEADFARCSDCSEDHLDPAVGARRVQKALDAAIASATES